MVNPLPSPTITGISSVCEQGQLNLSVSGGSSFNWAGPSGFSGNGTTMSIPSIVASNSGIYTVTATDNNGCTNTTTRAVAVNGLPDIATVGSTVCAHTTVNLSASGGTAFVWSGPSGFAGTGPVQQIQDASTSMIGTYTVTVTDANGCVSSSMTSVQVNDIPTVTVSANTPICTNQTVTLKATSSTAKTYVWTGPNGFSSNVQNPVINNAQAGANGVYLVTVIDNIGCSAKETLTMIVNPLPVVSVAGDKTKGCVPLNINFNPQSSVPLQSVLWQFGDGNSVSGLSVQKVYTKAGTFTITSFFRDVNGCSNSASFMVEAYPKPVADFNYSPTNPIINENIDFTDDSRGANISSWTWSFSHLKNQPVLNQHANLFYANAGTYAVAMTVMSDKGCRDTLVKAITIGDDFGIYVPDAFSPNGDGLNDIFQPKGFGIVKYEMNIYDRWGERIFTTTEFEQGWDGSFPKRAESELKEDVYVWQIKLVSVFGKVKEISGKVSLIR
jgi:gliding motility-associated-like protein